MRLAHSLIDFWFEIINVIFTDSVVLVVMLGSGGVAVLGIIYKCLITCLNDSKYKNQVQ